MKYVYFFGAGKADGDGNMKEVLGGKGAGLAEMTRAGLPVQGSVRSHESADESEDEGRRHKASGASPISSAWPRPLEARPR